MSSARFGCFVRRPPRGAIARGFGVLCALAALVTAGCATSPDPTPPVAIPDAFSDAGTGARPDRWWQDFGDDALARLVDEALVGNLELRTVWDRLAQARAVARREGAALLPSADLSGSAQATWSERPDVERTLSGTDSGLVRDDVFRLGLSLSWELDLFGRVRALRDAARLDADATAAELRAAAVALSAQVALQWYGLAEQTRQLALLDEQIRTNQDVLQLVTARFRAGQAGAADVLRQRQLVEQRRGERVRIAAQALVSRHALAVLLGRAPGAVDLPEPEALPRPGAVPMTGLPSELLTRRPDVRQAYLDLLAADRRLWSARADRLPRLSITASPAFTAEAAADLVDNWVAELAGNLVAPVFDAGRRRAEVERSRAAVSERLHRYGQVVLTSFQEVEDALVQEDQQRQLIESLDAQRRLARGTLERLRERYVQGASDYLDVLDALASLQGLERDLLTARRELIDFRIALHRALAGGFGLEAPEMAAARTGATPEATGPVTR